MWRTFTFDHGEIALRLCFNCEIADREVGRREEVEKKLDYISQQLERLKITEQLPENTNVPSDALINRAIDVRSASMLFLAAHIRHESDHLGIIDTRHFPRI